MMFNQGLHLLYRCALMCLIVVPSKALINLAKGKHTSQSSDYDPRTVSSLAVDGCAVQDGICINSCNNFTAFCCIYQQFGQTYAWWSVDLGQISEIAYIFVYFAKYVTFDFEVFRTQGYTIRISNNTDPQSGRICFQDTSYNLNNYTRVRNHSSCSNITGRYVHFTNRGDALNHNNADLEFCEVQVYGCQIGTYGHQCSQLCDSSCLGGRCDLYTGQCFACRDGKFIDDTGICTDCNKNCFHCINYHSCTECNDTYYVNAFENAKVCTRCPDNCKTCENYNGCISCYDNYFLHNKECQHCPTHCLNCENYRGCTDCHDNYYLNSQVCQPCPTYCSNCQNHLGCTACIDNYYLWSQVCQPCQANCSTCTDDIVCSMCKVGFALENNICVKCEKNCLKCIIPTLCSECKPEFFLQLNNCLSCPEYCIDCREYGNCTKCKDGHYIAINGECIACTDSCKNCSSAGCTDLLGNIPKNQVNLATYIGAAAGILVIFSALIVLLVLYKRKRATKKNNSNYYEENMATTGNIYDELASSEDPNYANSSQKDYYNTTIFHIDINASYQNTF